MALTVPLPEGPELKGLELKSPVDLRTARSAAR
ncbi:hypothetical protein GGE29_002950 [Agrobacterium tumefaciens]|nr:hypothetical protein [Agrobacterium radiobacter]